MPYKNLYSAYLDSSGICHDTRQIIPGCVYWAIKGARFDGNTFTEQALNQGARYAVVDDPAYKLDDRCFLVEDSLQTLQQMAKYHRQQLGIPIIAITGSNGKTTTKELMQLVLSKKYRSFATPGNLNNHIGLPLTLLKLTHEHEIAIIELGANHQGENAFLCGICEPDAGLITNIGKDHLEGFGGMEGVEKANLELFDHLKAENGIALINLDDERIARNTKDLTGISYGTGGNARLQGRILGRFPYLKVEIVDLDKGEKTEVRSHLFGSFHLYNMLAATAAGVLHHVPLAEIAEALEQYIPRNNRSQVITKDSNTYIMDAYNANPSSMEVSIKEFTEYPAQQKVMILGDMFELGADSPKEHEAMLKSIDFSKFKAVALAGEAFYEWKDKFPGVFFRTTDEAKNWFAGQRFEQTTFYLKGSRGMQMEKVVADNIYY